MEEFTANEFDLARNFGYDITMPDGNMGLAGAFHNDYMDKCQSLYREFITNMNIHINNENDIKSELKQLHKEKMDNLRFSLYRSENAISDNDPFSRRQEVFSVSPICWESRGNTPWGLDNIPDEDEELPKEIRPQTAPAPTKRTQSVSPSIRPKTAIIAATPLVNDTASDTGISDATHASNGTVVGVMDMKTERSKSRKITIGHQSFGKLQLGNLKAKLKNKDGKFTMKPIKHDFSKEDSDNVAYEPNKLNTSYDPLNERLALVKQITSFRSPTIASDMKINNRVPIQKNLKGIKAKRTTVFEIYQNARDRRTRHFRIVDARPSITSTVFNEVGDTGKLEPSSSVNNRPHGNILTIDDIPYSNSRNGNYSRNDSQMSDRFMFNMPPSRENTPTFRQLMSPPPGNDGELSNSGNQTKLRSILLHSGNQNNREVRLDESSSTQDFNRRPASRVAFMRPESQQSGVSNARDDGTPDLSKSMSSTLGVNFGKTKNLQYNNQKKNQNGTNFHSENPSRNERSKGTDSRLSFSSVVSAVSIVNRLNTGARVSVTPSLPDRSDSQLSFKPPAKMESKKDSVNIIKQQKQMDKQLDERMTVWRRRMAAKSSGPSKSKMGKGRLRLI